MYRTSVKATGAAIACAAALLAGCTGGGQGGGQGGYGGGGGGQSPPPQPTRSQPGGTGGGEKQVNQAARKDLQAKFADLLSREPITFEPGTAELTQQGSRTTSRVAKMITSSPGQLTFLVVGHTAPEPPGTPQEAKQLSTERARTVADSMKQKGVTDPVKTKGAGDDAQGQGPARSVDIKVM